MSSDTSLSPSSWIPVLLVLLLAAIPSNAEALPAPQTPSAAQQEPIVDSVRVEVVNIEVLVTDRQGNPVTDLTRDDFQLLVDGKAVEISNFSAVSDHSVARQEDRQAAEQPQPQAEPPATPSPPESDLSVVVIIDDAGLQRQSRREAFAALRSFLEPLVDSGCRLSLVRFNGSLEVNTELRDDPAAVLVELDRLEDAVPGGSLTSMQWIRLVRMIERKRLTSDDIQFEVLAYVEKLRAECKVKIRVIAAHITTLAGLPGRKVVLFVSDGIPARPGESLFSLLAPDQAKILASRYSLTRELRDLTDLANASGVTMHTIMGDSWTVAGLTHRTTELAATNLVQGLSFITDSNHSFSMGMIAERTGGMAVAAKTAALEKIARTLETYYSLGFIPDDADLHEWQRINVKVPGREVTVRHRRSVRQLARDEAMAADALATMHDESPDNPLQAWLEIGKQAEKDGRSYLLPVNLHIPNEHLVLLPEGGSWRGSVVVHLTARDKRGDVVEPVKDTLPVLLPDQVYRAGAVQELVYEVQLLLRAGATRIGVSVHDEQGGQQSSLSVEIDLGKDGTVTIKSPTQPTEKPKRSHGSGETA